MSPRCPMFTVFMQRPQQLQNHCVLGSVISTGMSAWRFYFFWHFRFRGRSGTAPTAAARRRTISRNRCSETSSCETHTYNALRLSPATTSSSVSTLSSALTPILVGQYGPHKATSSHNPSGLPDASVCNKAMSSTPVIELGRRR